MDEEIDIASDVDTPHVKLNKAEGVFEITGVSYPEDVRIFYGPILYWLSNYAQSPNPETRFVFRMEYFNTATSKILLDVMVELEKMHEAGEKVVIEWHYEDGDDDMQESGQDYADIIKVPFEHHSYEAEDDEDQDFIKSITQG